MPDIWDMPKERLFELYKIIWEEINNLSNLEHYLFLVEHFTKDIEQAPDIEEALEFIGEQINRSMRIKARTILAKIMAIAENYNVKIEIPFNLDEKRQPEELIDLLKDALYKLTKLLINKKILPPPEELEEKDIEKYFEP